MADSDKTLIEWRKTREERLKAPGGWLSVVGLSWLKKGENSVGSGFDNDVRLPKTTPAKLGTLIFDGKAVVLSLGEVAELKINDKSVEKNSKYPLDTDSKLRLGSVEFFPIVRKNGTGIRVIDYEAEAIKKFKGCTWFPEDPKFLITAKWVPVNPPKKLFVPDVIGNMNEEISPGYVEFQIEGQTQKLYPTQEGDSLFFVFRDSTSGKETYGSSRFLYADLPKSGDKIVLNFNRAYNPPCAFTDFATCPKAPAENVMKVAVRAGEKDYAH